MKYVVALLLMYFPMEAAAGNSCGASNEHSSMRAICPSDPGMSNGVFLATLKDDEGEPMDGMSVAMDFAGAGDCTGACSTSDPQGKATCYFSCEEEGVKQIGILVPRGITKKAICTL